MMPTHSQRTHIVGLIFLSLAARSAVLRHNLWRLREDVDDYLRLAENLSQWNTLGSYDIPSAMRPPLYPLLLAPLYWLQEHLGLEWGWRVSGIAVLHVGLGAATAVITYLLARRLELGRWSLLAGALVAVDPILLHHARLAMTETTAAFFVALSLYLLVVSDRQAGSVSSYSAGIALGLGMLCRTTIWAFAAVAIGLGGVLRGTTGRRHVEWMMFTLATALVVQLPWCVRNWRTSGHLVLTTVHGGYTLLLGNNEAYYEQVIETAPFSAWSRDALERWQGEMNIRAALDGVRTEVERDRFNYRVAWAAIKGRPSDFALAVIVRFTSFWRVMPHADGGYSPTVRWGCAVFYVPVLGLVLLGLACRRAWQWPLVLVPAALLSFTAVHAVYWSDMRMRAAVTSAVAIAAALGAERVWGWTERRSGPLETSASRQP
jgi:4-amino-4-deoxy-L-arabinose transferase-like glycosyltransferase